MKEGAKNLSHITKYLTPDDLIGLLEAPETREKFAPGQRPREIQRQLGETIARALEKAPKELENNEQAKP